MEQCYISSHLPILLLQPYMYVREKSSMGKVMTKLKMNIKCFKVSYRSKKLTRFSSNFLHQGVQGHDELPLLLQAKLYGSLTHFPEHQGVL